MAKKLFEKSVKKKSQMVNTFMQQKIEATKKLKKKKLETKKCDGKK